MPVVDASVVVDWVAPDVDARAPARRLLGKLVADGADLAAPRLLMEEVGNALLTGVRRARWDGATADAAFGLLRSLPISLRDEPRDLDRAWDLSRRYDEHPLYDMVYVALAERLQQQLITADEKLRSRLTGLGFVDGP